MKIYKYHSLVFMFTTLNSLFLTLNALDDSNLNKLINQVYQLENNTESHVPTHEIQPVKDVGDKRFVSFNSGLLYNSSALILKPSIAIKADWKKQNVSWTIDTYMHQTTCTFQEPYTKRTLTIKYPYKKDKLNSSKSSLKKIKKYATRNLSRTFFSYFMLSLDSTLQEKLGGAKTFEELFKNNKISELIDSYRCPIEKNKCKNMSHKFFIQHIMNHIELQYCNSNR